MSSINEQISSFRQQWLAIMASVTAFLAIFGINLPKPTTTSTDSKSSVQSEGVEVRASVRNRPASITPQEWEDPLEELTDIFAETAPEDLSERKIHEVLRGRRPGLALKILEEALQSRDSRPSELLITIQVVPGQSRLNSKEARMLWGHAFRMALSDGGFSIVQENYLAAYECTIKTDIPGEKDLPRTISLPMRLYQKSNQLSAMEVGRDSKTTEEKQYQFLLNFWLEEDYLGKEPWKCLKALRDKIVEDLIPEKGKTATWAIIGPGRSGTLEAMEPAWETDKDIDEHKFVLPGDLHLGDEKLGKPLYWINAHCTVPLTRLWNQPGSSQGQKIRWIQATPDDRKMLKLLATELRTRLAPAGIPAIQSRISKDWRASQHRSILLFFEQDSEFGKNLCTTLANELRVGDGESSPWSFECRMIPYLRGVGFVNRSEQDPKAVDSTSNQVADYFRRTLEEEPMRLVDVLEKKEQPLAIGILGGELPDKLALLREIRARYPQSLVFTNDLKIQYLNQDTLPLFRNVLVAAHAPLKQEFSVYEKGRRDKPSADVDSTEKENAIGEAGIKPKPPTSVSFRDEVQATLWYGYQRLFAEVFPQNELPGKGAGVVSPETEPPAMIFEVGNRAFWESRSVESSWLQRMSGGFCVFLLFAFPWLHRRWIIQRLEWDSEVQSVATASRLVAVEQWIQGLLPARVRIEATRLGKNVPLLVTCLMVILVCCWPVNSLSEASWIKPSQEGFFASVVASLVNNTMTFFTGVSVMPSILTLTFCLPFTFWPALKKEIERTAFQDHAGRTGKIHEEHGMEGRLASIDELVGFLGARRIPSRSEKWSAVSVPSQEEGWQKYFRSHWRAPILYGLFGLIVGMVIAWFTGRHWVIQISALATISSALVRGTSARRAILIAFLVCMGIEQLAWIFGDYASVPARDHAVRAIGSSIFAVAYWWLLVGLIKLFIQQFQLKAMLRDATNHVTKAQSSHRLMPVNMEVLADKVRNVDHLMIRIQDASRLISRDLLHLSLVGLVICFARMPWFDAWGMSVATWLTIVIPMTAPFISSILLRRTAFEFRGSCHRYLSNLEYQLSELPDTKALLEMTERWHQRVNSHNQGVFSPLDQDPLVSMGVSLLVAFSSGPQGDFLRKMFGFLMI